MKVVAKALIFDKQARILVLRRSASHPRFAQHFDFPGGEVEQGEDPAETVAREIKEETGLIIKLSELDLCLNKDLSNELKHMLFMVTRKDTTPKVSISWEHDSYQWMTASDLLKQPLPANADSYYTDVMKWLGSSRQAESC